LAGYKFAIQTTPLSVFASSMMCMILVLCDQTVAIKTYGLLLFAFPIFELLFCKKHYFQKEAKTVYISSVEGLLHKCSPYSQDSLDLGTHWACVLDFEKPEPPEGYLVLHAVGVNSETNSPMKIDIKKMFLSSKPSKKRFSVYKFACFTTQEQVDEFCKDATILIDAFESQSRTCQDFCEFLVYNLTRGSTLHYMLSVFRPKATHTVLYIILLLSLFSNVLNDRLFRDFDVWFLGMLMADYAEYTRYYNRTRKTEKSHLLGALITGGIYFVFHVLTSHFLAMDFQFFGCFLVLALGYYIYNRTTLRKIQVPYIIHSERTHRSSF